MKSKFNRLTLLILAAGLGILVFYIGTTYVSKPKHVEAQTKFEFSDFGEIQLPVQERAYYGMIGDMNGDGKPDIVLVGTGKVLIIKNTIPKAR